MKIGITCYPAYGGSGAVASELGIVRAALEALACGIPVIASKLGGIPEVVTHGETGYLFPLGEVDGMAEAGLSLLESRDRWDRFGAAARADPVTRFPSERVVPMYEGLYRGVPNGELEG